MIDEAAGFQRFLFEWFGWPITEVLTYEGPRSFVYAQNLVPLLYIEQTQGWTEPRFGQRLRRKSRETSSSDGLTSYNDVCGEK